MMLVVCLIGFFDLSAFDGLGSVAINSQQIVKLEQLTKDEVKIKLSNNDWIKVKGTIAQVREQINKECKQ